MMAVHDRVEVLITADSVRELDNLARLFRQRLRNKSIQLAEETLSEIVTPIIITEALEAVCGEFAMSAIQTDQADAA